MQFLGHSQSFKVIGEITRTVANSDAVEEKLLFTPGRLTDGIELSDDPLLTARDGSYAESFKRRSAPESPDK